MVTSDLVIAVYAKVPNRPGELENLLRALAAERLAIDAASLETVGSVGFVRLVAKRPEQVVRLLRARGIEAFESELVVATVSRTTTELTRLFADLAAARVNVEALLTLADGRVALRTSDNDLAQRILSKM